MNQESSEQSYLSRLTVKPSLKTGGVASYLKNFRITILLLLSIVFIGIVAYINLPKRLNPEVKIPIVNVVTLLPGAGPEDVESLVTIPLENSLQSVSGLDTISSSSQNNVSVITVQFTSATNQDKAKEEVQSLIDGVKSLPSDAKAPQVTALDFENQPIWQFAVSTDKDVASLQRFVGEVKQKLEDEAKIREVTVTGLEKREVAVEISVEKAGELGINPLQISQALKSGLMSYPAGTVETINNSYSFTIDQEIKSLDDIRNIRLSLRGSSIRLGDIATVAERAVPNQPKAFIGKKGEDVKNIVTFNVYKTSNAKISDAAKAAQKVVEDEIKLFDNRFTITSINNTDEEISDQFGDLLKEFRATIILVFVCLYIFLGLRQAIISSLTVPLTFLSAFALMQYTGMSINFLTLFAFLLSLGLLVDDTIVVISAMTTYYKTGKFTPLETGLLVWRDTIVPIWSTTITTIWSFIPLLLATGIIGEFIKPIPVVVTLTMISSTAIAVLITLPIMIIILKPNIPKRVILLGKIVGLIASFGLILFIFKENALLPLITIFYIAWAFVVYKVWKLVLSITKKEALKKDVVVKIFEFIHKTSNHGVISTEGFAEAYKRLISRILASKKGRRNVIIAIVSYAVIGFLLLPMGFVKNEFFPKTASARIYLELQLDSGATLARTEQATLTLLDKIKEYDHKEFVVAEVGKSSPGGFGGGGGDKSNNAVLTIHLPKVEKQEVSSIFLEEELREYLKTYPEKVVVSQQSGGPPAGADLQITLEGESLTKLNEYADKLVSALSLEAGVVNPEKSIKAGTSAIAFVPDLDKLSQLGLDISSVGFATRLFASGFTLAEVNFDASKSEKIPVRFMFASEIPAVETIGKVMIGTTNGQVPLLSLGELRLKTNPTSISRENGKRTMTVSASVARGVSATEKNKRLTELVKDLNLEEGYSTKTGGVNEENAKSIQSILQAMGVAFLLIMVTMVLQFRSFRQAAIVLIVIPLAVSSVFYVFALSGTPLSFPALIGVLSLFGIVVTNSMFIVDKINLNQKEGMSFNESIADAGASRMEPIILTKLATVLGLLPITLSNPLWRGLGGAIISGLLLASTIMLLFIPVLYHQWMKPTSKRA